MNVRVVRGDAVFLGEGSPLRDGCVVLDEDETILDAGPAGDVIPRHQGARVETVRGVLLPGLVNAHTHLELSGLRGKVTGGAGFVPWVERMLGIRAAERPEEDASAIDRAVTELVQFGTVAVGDVTNTLAALPSLVRLGVGGIVFHELFGIELQSALARLAAMENDGAEARRDFPSPDVAYALAPHTVYTTHPDAIRTVLERVRGVGGRTTVHLAEHTAERMLTEQGSGPFFDFMTRMRLPVSAFPIPHKSPVEYASDLGLLAPDALLVHLTDARTDELARIAASGAHVVLCPRSNLFIEVKLPPLGDILKAGILPALGTDSLASNLSLDVLAEAKALHDRFPSVPASSLLSMATYAGARALGRADLGRIAKGLRPGVLAVTGELRADDDPARFVLQQPAARRAWVSRRPPLRSEDDRASARSAARGSA